MNAKIIEALEGIRDNLNIIIEEVKEARVAPVTPAPVEVEEPDTVTPAPAERGRKAASKTRKEKEEAEVIPEATATLTQEQLDGMSYNNLKKLAKEMGISASGARDELTQKILNAGVVAPVEEEVEEAPAEEEEIPVVPTTPVVEEDEDEDEEEEDPIIAKVNEAVEDMSNEEIMDVLADVGVTAKGKRQSLISAVVKAVREGKIDLDDEEVEEDEVEESEVEEATSEVEYDVNDPENPEMTDARREALEAYEAETRESFEEGSLTRKELINWLNEFNNTKDTMKKKSDEDILNEYIYCSSLFIDDEGEMPDEGAYTVNGTPYCCGHELQYDDETENFICEICGEEYEAGEE